jgi:hypothetical protein
MEGRIRKGRYQHFKGHFYRVLGVARHSEDPEREFVVYQALYVSKDFGRNSLWIRPKKMFLEKVRKDGKLVPRFRYIGSG